jgi:hypothetical protein
MSGFTLINVGAAANDGNGDSLRVSQQAVNSNYTSTPRSLSTVADLATEAAASGYTRIVADLTRGGVFKAVNGGAANGITIFASATAGWTWQRQYQCDIMASWAGVVGDGITDNYAAIASIVTAFPNGAVINFGNDDTDVFGVSQGIEITGDSYTLIGAGTIKALSTYDETTEAGIIHLNGAESCHILIGTDGNRAENTGTPASGFVGNNVMMNDCYNCHAATSTHKNSVYHAIAMVGATSHCSAKYNKITTCGLNALLLHWRIDDTKLVTDCEVVGNDIDGTMILDQAGASIWLAATKRCKVERNNISGGGKRGIVLYCGDVGPNIRDNEVLFNTVDGAEDEAIYLDGQSSTTSTVYGCSYNVFLGNTFKGSLSTPNGVLRYCEHNTFTGDVFDGGAGNGIDLQIESNRNTFTGVRVDRSANVGWRVSGGSQNDFIGCSAEENASTGLTFTSSASYNKWIGGRLGDEFSGAPVQAKPFEIAAGCAGNMVAFAQMFYNTTDNYTDNGTNSIIMLNQRSTTTELEMTGAKLLTELVGNNLISINASGGPKLLSGTGSPEGVTTAPVGSVYVNVSGGASTTFYVKESGVGNTGWVAK